MEKVVFLYLTSLRESMPVRREWNTTALPGTTLATMLLSGAEPLLFTMPVSFQITGVDTINHVRGFGGRGGGWVLMAGVHLRHMKFFFA